MPIEDVDYLKANSIRQSYIFLVDSADRDKNAYPTPSEYVVDFTTPFHNVIGFEVVHASIPRTMYNIDVINNSITFFIHTNDFDLTSFNATMAVTTHVTPGEYTIQTLAPELTRAMTMYVNNNPNMPYVSITAESTTNPPDVNSTLRFKCPYPFFMVMGSSTIAESLGFDTFTQKSEADAPWLSKRYEAPLPEIRQLYHSVDLPPDMKLGDARLAFEGPRGVVRKLPIGTTKYVAQRFWLTSKGYLTQVFAALNTMVVSPGDAASWEIRTGTRTQPDMNTPALVSGMIAVSFTDGTLSDSNIVRCELQSHTFYWLVIKATPDLFVYYNDVLIDETTLWVSEDAGQSWVSTDKNGIRFNVSVNIIVQDQYHVITAPGIYSLIGPKYIVLRCPEIEENSFRSLAYGKHHLGLGMFRLGVVGYSENRMDFNKVPLREFHPIGKLKRLSLRFELPNGELYDFKGVNHTITFAIHYYEPIQKKNFSTSILNPNYDGNFIQYMYRQQDQESDSDDQEEDFNRDDLNMYQQREQYYLPDNQWKRDMDFIHRLPMQQLSDEESD
jgi:hypothetical protein